jgi:hypothetical protein
VLEDQLLLAIVLQQHRILVERADLSGELHPANQLNRNRGLVFANSVQKRVLNVLCRLVIHEPISFTFYQVER